MTIQSHLFQPSQRVDKRYILNNLSQERIMSYYLGVDVQYDNKFKSPLRVDNTPTCNFSWNSDKLWFRDWAMNRPLDIFSVVMERYICNFSEAIDIIAEDFGLKDKETNREVALSSNLTPVDRGNRNSEKSKIQVKIQRFTQQDIDYLTSYGIHSNTVKKFNVFSPAIVWLNDGVQYAYSSDNPALAYYFGKDNQGNEKWKIYFYKKRGDFRFLGNTSRINGWIQIPQVDDLLVITKSLKDVMCMYEWGINTIAMQAETTIPYDYIIEELKQRFNSIVTLYDYDKAGITNANRIKELYDIPALFLNETLNIDSNIAKDFSDYIKVSSREEIIDLVEAIQLKAISNGNDRTSSAKELTDLQRNISEVSSTL